MDKDKPIIIGSDHAAFELKEKIKTYLSQKGVHFLDAGTDSEASVNYVDYGKKWPVRCQQANMKKVFCSAAADLACQWWPIDLPM